MNLRDLIYRKNNIDNKINELKFVLKRQPSDKLAEELVFLVDARQKTVLSIQSANNQCFLSLGESKVDLNTAVVIRDNMKLKIDTLTEIINSDSDFSLDRVELMKQRDKFLEDFALLDMSIINTDINTKLG
jgi:hypothetical protein